MATVNLSLNPKTLRTETTEVSPWQPQRRHAPDVPSRPPDPHAQGP